MPRKKIGYIERVNELTGELTKSVSWYSNKYTEKFIMVRTTDSLDWFYPLGKNEKSLILMLHDWSNAENMRLSLQTWQRDKICDKLNVGRRQISLLLKSLENADCIKRLSQNDFMVNPAHANKCGTKEWRKRTLEYNSIKTTK